MSWFRFTLSLMAHVGILAWLVGDSGYLSAQEAETTPAASTVEETKQQSSPSIYIPYEKLVDVFGKDGAAAIMPYADLQKLLKLLEDHQPQLPVAALTKSSYQITVEKDFARIEAIFSLRSEAEGWATIRLPLQGAAVGQATWDQEGALFRGAKGGTYFAQLPGKGDYELKLEMLVSVQSSPDRRSIKWQTPLSAVTTAQVTLPLAEQSLSVKPESVVTPVEGEVGQTQANVNLGATESVEISWRPEESAQPQMELLTSVQNRTVVTLADGLMHTEAVLGIDVLRGEISEFQILVPKSHRILGVSSESVNVQRQSVAETDDNKVITVKLLQAVSKKFELEVHTEQPLPEGTFSLAGTDEEGVVSGISVSGAIRESGTISIAHSSDTRLLIEQQEGLIRVEGNSVPDAVRDRANVHFKFYSPVFTLTGQVKPVEPRIQVTHLNQHVFQKDLLLVTSTLNYNIERAGIFDLSIKLPEDLELQTVKTENLREYNIDDATGTLTISFQEKRTGVVQVILVGRVALQETGEDQLSLPIPEPLGVFQETGSIVVMAPPAIEIDTIEAETLGVIPENAGGNGSQNNLRMVSRWSYQSRPVTVTVRTLRKPTRLSARLESYVNVNEDQTSVQTVIRYQVEHAPVRFFQLRIPEAVNDSVTLRVPEGGGQSIQSQVPSEEAVDGWFTWTIELTQETLGEQLFEVVYDLPLTREGEDQLSEQEVTLVSALPALTDAEDGDEIPLVRTVGEVGVARDRSLAMTSELTAEQSEAIDRRELTMNPRTSDRAYRYYTQPVSLTLRSRKFEIQPVIETVVSRALVEVAIGYDPQATYRCRYLVTTSERQRLLLKLPVNADPLSVLVDGQRVDLEQAEDEESSENYDAYYVNISRKDGASEQLNLTLQFLWPINPPQFKGPLGTLQLGFPQLGSQGGDAAVQQCRLAIWVPDKFHLVGTPSRFNDEQETRISAALAGFPTSPPVSQEELNAWISNVPTGAIEFPAEGIGYSYQTIGEVTTTRVSWWEMYYMVWVLSGTLLVIGWLLKNTSWENRLGVILLLVFLAAVYAVKDDDTIAHIVAAARFGLLAVAVLWSIQICLGTDWKQRFAPTSTTAEKPPEEKSDADESTPPDENAQEQSPPEEQ